MHLLKTSRKTLEDELSAERKSKQELEVKIYGMQKNEEVKLLNERIKALTDENAAFVSKMEFVQEKSANVIENLKKEAAETETLRKEMATMKATHEDKIKALNEEKIKLEEMVAELRTANEVS